MSDHLRSKRTNRGLRRASVLGWMHLTRFNNHVAQSATLQLSAWGLSNAQFDVLTHVGAAEGSLQIDLAGRLLVTQGNVTQLLDKLEERGLIRRVREGRAKRLYLTPAGR